MKLDDVPPQAIKEGIGKLWRNIRSRLSRVDVVLIASLMLALGLCLKRINWGRLESWNPDYIAIDSPDYSRFIDNRYYPSLERYFLELQNQEYACQIVFDVGTKEYPSWIYPSEIKFLSNRIIILEGN